MSLYAIDRDTGITLYAQIAEVLEREYVRQGAPGDRLPAEGELAARFGVNRHTLRRAVDELILEGMLERQHGVGIFITDRLLDYKLGSGTRFTQTLGEIGVATDSRVVRKMVAPASAGVARNLNIETDEDVLWIETLRIADGLPFCVISHFLPLTPFRELLEDYQSGSLHALLNQHCGALRRTESLVTAVMPQGDDAKLLGITQHRPVLRVKSLNVRTQDDSPVEYAITRFRADRIQLCITPTQ
ncbi:MAG: phosphonate metabolism transcriptional regulator PhnF [Gammaproteobacteria bacterium]|nr:phosphonate metabolism transcriptional regulator PhnF [Gammaproteobacteria bacterium]MBU1624805.1 phosphonate metabolism transcriptional regulator PhnF [Gammaproteobacteria bacterium]MBU1982649.1 phosphonate metabolism transcriptional regulator PhnF [Gammaproteobacteria bacterium]